MISIRLLKLLTAPFSEIVAIAEIDREHHDLPQVVTWHGRLYVLDTNWLFQGETRPAYVESLPLALSDECVRVPEGKS